MYYSTNDAFFALSPVILMILLCEQLRHKNTKYNQAVVQYVEMMLMYAVCMAIGEFDLCH